MARTLEKNGKLAVALVTGRHPHDVPGLHNVFRAIDGIDFYPQHMEDFTADPAGLRNQYDVVVFYNFHQETPNPADEDWCVKEMAPALESLGTNDQGVFLLHHSILAFPKWPFWHDLVGVQDYKFSSYHIGEKLQVDVAGPNHPITKGLESWEMVDETYVMSDPDEGCHVLLTTEHPKSTRSLAWTHQFKNARVFCLQSGHDNDTFVVPQFRTVVERGVFWCAGKL